MATAQKMLEDLSMCPCGCGPRHDHTGFLEPQAVYNASRKVLPGTPERSPSPAENEANTIRPNQDIDLEDTIVVEMYSPRTPSAVLRCTKRGSKKDVVESNSQATGASSELSYHYSLDSEVEDHDGGDIENNEEGEEDEDDGDECDDDVYIRVVEDSEYEDLD
jgi:hypothetical protein